MREPMAAKVRQIAGAGGRVDGSAEGCFAVAVTNIVWILKVDVEFMAILFLYEPIFI